MIVSLQPSMELGIRVNHGRCKIYQQPVLHASLRGLETPDRVRLMGCSVHFNSLQVLYAWDSKLTNIKWKRVSSFRSRNHQFRCHCFLNPGPSFDANYIKNATLTLVRSYSRLQGCPLETKLASAVGIVIFAIWGLVPLVRLVRKMLLHKSEVSWKRSCTYQLTTSYVQPLLLWTGALLICRSLDPVLLPTEAAQLVKKRSLNFVRSLSTVLAFAYCLSSAIQQAQKFFMEISDPTGTTNMGFDFAGKAVYTCVWLAAATLFLELLGFSTQKWLTAGGLGTVLLTLAGREIFTNFLSSIIIHATGPFDTNEWIQTKIEGYDVSGTVERVGWWAPTIIRGEDREAVHIPNHKFTVNVVRNLTKKTHWRIKTHLCISHLDVSKINNIVSDMRKVLSKNPQVEQQKLHRRVFLDNIDPENQALMILISCFVKTSHVEEYLCVKEAVLLDLLKVIRHHRARLATPIRSFQKLYAESNLDNIPFSESMSSGPLLLVEPAIKINGEDQTKSQAGAKSAPETKADAKSGGTSTNGSVSVSKSTEQNAMQSSDEKAGSEVVVVIPEVVEPKDDPKTGAGGGSKSSPEAKLGNGAAKSVPTADKETKKSQNLSPETVSEVGARRSDNVSNPSPSKQDATGLASKSSLKENIVLGVALEGSKRTLPIDDEATNPPSKQEDVKELAPLRSCNSKSAALVAEKGEVEQQP